MAHADTDTSSAIVVSLFRKGKWQSEKGCWERCGRSSWGTGKWKVNCFRWQNPSDPGPWLPSKCMSEGGWAVYRIPIHLLLFPGKTCNSSREDASVKSDTLFPLVVSACSNCSLQETLRAALIHKWEAVQAELWLGNNLFPFKTINYQFPKFTSTITYKFTTKLAMTRSPWELHSVTEQIKKGTSNFTYMVPTSFSTHLSSLVCLCQLCMMAFLFWL